MKRIAILLLLVTNIICAKSQGTYTPIKFPERGSRGKVEYENHKKDYIECINTILDPNASHEHKVGLGNWNLFLSIFHTKPKDADILLKAFLAGFHRDPVSFCDDYGEFQSKLDWPEHSGYSTKHEFKVMKNICTGLQASYDKALIKELDRIEESHLKARNNNDRSAQKSMDSINLLKIEKIIERHGYPGKSLVGSDYASVAAQVILFAEVETIEKYLPLIVQEYENHNIYSGITAKLIDKHKVLKGEKQLYGTQINDKDHNKPYPNKKEAEINMRRVRMALPQLELYPKVKRINGNWAYEK